MLRLSCGAPIALLLCLAIPAAADEVVLTDGTTIVGTVTSLAGGTLTIEGGAAGKVQVPFANIRSVTTTGDHTVVLADGRRVRGRFSLGAGGAPELVVPGGASEAVAYATIAEIDPPEKKPVEYTGNITVGGKSTGGNTDIESITSIAELVRRTEKDRLSFFGDWNYSEDDGRVTQRNASGRGKYDYFIRERLFVYGNGSLEGDEFADLDLRSTVGAGGGIQFLDDAKWKYYEEAGVSYIDEDLADGASEEYASSRVSGNIDWVLTPERVTFFHFHEVFWSLEDSDDILVDSRTGFRFTLISNFFAAVQVNYKWDNTPSAGSERTDTEYLLSLGYSFAF